MNMQSEHIDQLADALAKAQSEMPSAVKDSKNPFYKSSYATLESVREACLPYLNKQGISVSQSTKIDEHGRTILITKLLHKSGQWLLGEYLVKPVKEDPQGMGSALSYSRRYSLSALVSLAQADDDAEHAMGRGHTRAPHPAPGPVLPSNQPIGDSSTKEEHSTAVQNIEKIHQSSTKDWGEHLLPANSLYGGRRLKDLTNDQRTDLLKKFHLTPPRTKEGKEAFDALKNYLSPTASQIFKQDDEMPF